MSTPIDIIADTIHQNGWGLGHNDEDTKAIAASAAEALTNERIIRNAVEALKADGWEETHDGGTLSDEDLTNIAVTVLRSVGGAS